MAIVAFIDGVHVGRSRFVERHGLAEWALLQQLTGSAFAIESRILFEALVCPSNTCVS